MLQTWFIINLPKTKCVFFSTFRENIENDFSKIQSFKIQLKLHKKYNYKSYYN